MIKNDCADKEGVTHLETLAFKHGSSVRELVGLAKASPVLMLQLMDPSFAALAENCDPHKRTAFRHAIEEALDDEINGRH